MKARRVKKLFLLFTLALFVTVCGASTILAAKPVEVLRGPVEPTWYVEEERVFHDSYPKKIWVVRVSPGGQQYEGNLTVKKVYPRSNTGRYRVIYAGTLLLAAK